MENFIATLIYPAHDFLPEACEFYALCGRKTSLDPKDQLVVAYVDDQLAGIVRLCLEHGTYVLRTMQIHPQFQRRGLGTLLLHRFEDLLREKKIDSTFCMPYTHLESFYAQIGFEKIENENAPEFLQQRLQELHVKSPETSAILMRRRSQSPSTNLTSL